MVGKSVGRAYSEEWVTLAAQTPKRAMRMAQSGGLGSNARGFEGGKKLKILRQTEGEPAFPGEQGREDEFLPRSIRTPRRIIRRLGVRSALRHVF